MKYVIAALFCLGAFAAKAQSVYPIRADTVKIYKVGGFAELVLQNRTKDSIGLLINLGNGKTEFRRAKKLDSSHIIIGLDTLEVGTAATDSSIFATIYRQDTALQRVYDSIRAHNFTVDSIPNANSVTRGLLYPDLYFYYSGKVDSITISNDSVFQYRDGFDKYFAFKLPASSGTDSSIFATVTRLADSTAALRDLISSGFDSSISQGGGFHTQPYNDGRYVIKSDSVGPTGYASHGRVQKVSDSLGVIIAGKIANAGGAPSILEDVLANRPASSTTGAFFYATDTKVLYRWNGSAWDPVTVIDKAIANTKLADMAAHTYKGNNTGTSGAPSDVTAAQLAADLPAYTTTTPGVLSAPGTATGKVPFDNGTWGNIPYPSILFRYNVVDYGADTTGANATATRRGIDSCLAAAMRSPYPAAVVFPSGVYSIDSSLIDITKALAIEGYNAYLKVSNTNTFTILRVKSDSVRLRGMKFIGNGSNQKAVDINGYKYFSVRDGEFTSLSVGLRFANTSSTFSAGDVDGCNFFNNTIGIFSDTLGEYVTVRGGLFKSNTVAIQDDGGNNIFTSGNSNSNTTAFKFTGGSNNSHGMIIGWNANHNTTSIDANGAIYGETIVGSHFYEGNMTFKSCSNWRFTGQSIIGASTLTIDQCANMDFSDCFRDPSYGTTLNIVGNFNRPIFRNNMGVPNVNAASAGGTNTPLVDSLGGEPYRFALTADTLDLGVARWQYKSLSADDTIKKIIHPTAGRTYRLEVTGNGHNFVFLDNAKVSGTFNSAATLNVYSIECIDDGPDPRFIVRVDQPGVLVVRNTNDVGWGRQTGTATISGSSLTKTGPDNTAFTVWAVPNKVLASGDGYYSFQAISTYANIIAGLSDNPTQTTYTSIDFGIYFFGTSGQANNINIAENGTLISSGLGGTNWSTNDSFRVKVTGTTVTYEKYSSGSWSVFYTSSHAVTTYPLIPQVAIRALTTFTNPKLFGAGVINNLQSYYAVGYMGNIDATQAASGGSGISRITPLDSLTKDAKGMQISGNSLVPQTADGTYPGLISTGAQTIEGAKTFSSSPIVPTPSGSTDAANKGYVDGLIPTGGIAAGTYSPTISNYVNCSAISNTTFQYMKIGKQVWVFGYVTVELTASSGNFSFFVSLPTSTTAAPGGGSGTQEVASGTYYPALCGGTISGGAGVEAIHCNVNGTSGDNVNISFQFMYITD